VDAVVPSSVIPLGLCGFGEECEDEEVGRSRGSYRWPPPRRLSAAVASRAVASDRGVV